MKVFLVALLCVAVAQVALAQDGSSSSTSTLYNLASPFIGLYRLIKAGRDAVLGGEAPSMGTLGLTVRQLLTSWNPVSFLVSALGLDLILVPLLDILLASSGTQLGVVGNILWFVTQTPNPVGLLLGLLQLQGFVNYALNQLFLASA